MGKSILIAITDFVDSVIERLNNEGSGPLDGDETRRISAWVQNELDYRNGNIDNVEYETFKEDHPLWFTEY